MKPDLVLQRKMLPEEALRRAGWALKECGKLTVFNKDQNIVKGEIRSGGLLAIVNIKVVEKSDHVEVAVDVIGFDAMNVAASNAKKRFENAFDNRGQETYMDTVQVPKSAIAVIVIIAVLIWVLNHMGFLNHFKSS